MLLLTSRFVLKYFLSILLQNSQESDVVENKKLYILHQNVVYFFAGEA